MTRQTGYALILMVVALMGVGGVVVTGFTQGAKQETEHERYLHNQRILEQAKQALLQYAYNYPVTAGNGPGRMPCPDTDNDGIPNATANCSGLGGVGILGRFPWAEPEMHFYDARDASGERLWYGVSNQFANSGGGVTVNSDTVGSITIQDRSGAVLYDGSVNGVAAVIIAPGAPIDRNGVRQDRSVANGDDPFDYTDDNNDDKDTDPGIIDADKYLDLFGAIDNADFVNGTANGFVKGPIDNRVNGVLQVNDQMIVITAAEVIAMAEKATLQAYRKAIDDYLAKAGGVYPWLYNYDGIEYNTGAGESIDDAIDKLSRLFPADTNFATEKANYLGIDADNDGHFGRIPSIFANYFTETDSQPIESRLSGSLTVTFPVSGLTYTQLTKDLPPEPDFAPPAEFQFNAPPTPTFETGKISEVSFVNINLADDNEGRLRANFAEAEPPIELHMYFWDDGESPSGVWTPCDDDGDNIAELSDCHRADLATPTPGGAHLHDLEILHVVVTLDFPVTPGNVDFDMDYITAPTIAWKPATLESHARITATFERANIIGGTMPTISGGTYEYDPRYRVGSTALGEDNPSSFRAGSVDTADFSLDELTLGIRYYPELPAWTFTNDWHNSIRMAYAPEYEPGAAGPCTINATCLKLEDSPARPRNVISLLMIAGQHDWADTDLNGSLKNDLLTVFDTGNENDDETFYRYRGNDKILVIDDL